MDYKKKLRTRLYYGIICIVLGAIMIIGVTVTKSENEYISAFGFAVRYQTAIGRNDGKGDWI